MYHDKQQNLKDLALETRTLTVPGVLTVDMMKNGGFTCKVSGSSVGIGEHAFKKYRAGAPYLSFTRFGGGNQIKILRSVNGKLQLLDLSGRNLGMFELQEAGDTGAYEGKIRF